MKTNILLIVLLNAIFVTTLIAQDHSGHNHSDHEHHMEATLQTETFIVYGNCGMCEKTIETALKDVSGIESGDWDKTTDSMTVVFNPTIISLDNIKQKIADVGYDTDTHKANDKIYNQLPGCCQYERPKKN